MATINTKKIIQKQRAFAQARKWKKYHTPKNLAISLAIEAAELMEVFQWLNHQEEKKILRNKQKKQQISDEMADVLYYLIRLSDICKIDLENAFWQKMIKNEKKYPVKLARGNAKKWNELG